MQELSKIYDPKQVEDRIYKMWEDGGYFKGHIDTLKKPFTIVIPPPNVTGQLHLGHAFDNTVQDILIRYKRMQGYAALWIPGTDHAGIATQVRVEKELRTEEGITRHDLGREKFLERVWDWKHLYGSRIIEQLKKLGSSCDWSRERFTMDEGCSKAVREVFVSLYEKGLIYKGLRIINWCPSCTTALSDAEVEHEEREGTLYHLKYRVKGSNDSLVVATTRPETMLGDTGVAVNPKDKRYKHLIGKTVILPLMEREIPVVADEFVDVEFGTGAVKVTPCHDPNDFELGERHNLEHVLILDESAKIINCGKYNGLERYDARRKVLEDMEQLGLLVKTQEHKMNIGSCHRCNTIVEPVASEQWFVKMKPLAAPAIEVVKNGTIKIVPDRFTKVYTHWMENVRDWCISRQLWWGHRIPAWYCGCGYITVDRKDPVKCEKCGSFDITRDEDVLDTWFSSALWPFSTLGWPEKTPDLEYFYPTDVLSCGTDILFFWVARMIFSGLEFTGKAPFHTVAIHGMIRDNQGRIMSKSLGNGIDPIEVIEQYGADALRFNIITGNSPGSDMRFYPEKCEAMRNFSNKIWNASRFVMMNLAGQGDGSSVIGSESMALQQSKTEGPSPCLELEDKWILSKLNTLAKEITENLDKYELGIAAAKIYDFIWDVYCDWYIEITKPRLNSGGYVSENAQRVLLHVLIETLTILHPFMPFITEEIYGSLPTGEKTPLMMREYTKYTDKLNFKDEEEDFESIVEAIRAVRSRRAEMNVPPSKKSSLTIVTERPEVFKAGCVYIGRLAYASEVVITNAAPSDLSGLVTVATNEARLYMPLADLVDLAKERERIEREIAKVVSDKARVEQKLSNEKFTSKAPENIINAEKEKLEKLNSLLSNLKESLNAMK
ncbi:MAG: valine--tRNA ligase [Oscillospiraceae bacterium]|nr:valine--tRNA ligase [Oscillospiraceae bacterium]MCL2278689.1 valine--tRNA ligase [Oscillospiraceae bacterium]